MLTITSSTALARNPQVREGKIPVKSAGGRGGGGGLEHADGRKSSSLINRLK